MTSDSAEERRFLVGDIHTITSAFASLTERARRTLSDAIPTAEELEAVQDLHAELDLLCQRIRKELAAQCRRARS